jgi:hypothetical protein
MHPEVSLAMARARQMDIQRPTEPHGFSNPRQRSRAARRHWRLLPRPHLPFVSHRIRPGH